MNKRRYWEIEYGDGKIITEHQMEWKAVPKTHIKRLTLYYDGRQWSIEGKQVYFQKKRASVIPGIPESFQVEARTIGYYQDNTKVMYTVDENTGVMKMIVKDTN